MREGLERLGRAAVPADIAGALADTAARHIGYASFSFLPFAPGPLDPTNVFVRSSEFPLEPLRDCLLGAMGAVERELGGFEAQMATGPASFDIAERYPASVRQTRLFQEHWRPFKLERQLVGFLGAGAEPLGFWCVARSERERPFTRDDLRAFDRLRAGAERALAAARPLGAEGLARTLDALAAAFPAPAYLLDAEGRLQWASEEGVVRLSLESVRAGAMRLFRGSRALEALARAARAVGRDVACDPGALLAADGLLQAGERVQVRRFEEGGRPLLLLALEPGRPAGAPPPPEAAGRRLGLAPAEARVAALAAEGYTVLNIAARLGVTEATVRTHLRRAYVKLGVHTRAELAWKVAGGAAPR